MTVEINLEKLDNILSNSSLVIMDLLELLPFIIGLIYWKKFTGTPILWFILFLGYNFLNEIVAAFVYVVELVDRNYVFYNVRFLFYFSMYFWLFHRFLKRSAFKKATIIFYFCWLLTYVYFIVFKYFLYEMAVSSFIIGGFLVFIVILFFLIETINDSDLSKIQDSILFYISVGLLLNLVIQLPVYIITQLGWTQVTDSSDTRNTFFSIIRNTSFGISCIMYLIFAYGLYRAKRPKIKAT